MKMYVTFGEEGRERSRNGRNGIGLPWPYSFFMAAITEELT